MQLLYILPGAFFAPVIHEWVRAVVSTCLGDPTPKQKGFLSFNPFRYFELIGFILMLMFRMGWGQPVPTSPYYYKNRRRDTIIVNTVPSIANIVVGVLTIWLLNAITQPLSQAISSLRVYVAIVFTLLNFAISNIALAVFNLIPIYPLDGAKILQLFMRPDQIVRMNHSEKMLQMLLIFMMLFGFLGMMLGPIVNLILALAGAPGWQQPTIQLF